MNKRNQAYWHLRLCSVEGCAFYKKHVENCHQCAGFGRWKGVKANSLITGDEALTHVFAKSEYTRCPICGGIPPYILKPK